MTAVDLEPATRRMAALVGAVLDSVLDRPTPCPAYAVGDLLDHIGGLTFAFTAAARKDFADFRTRLETHVKRLKALDVNVRPLQ